MYWRREDVREAASLTAESTDIWDLADHGRLGSILFRISGGQISRYGQSGGAWRIIDEISKIEVIANGSEVIKSYAGDMAQAIAFYDQGVCAPDPWRNYATNTQYCYILVNFGRKLFDPASYLDLSKFSSVELKITNTASSSTDFSQLSCSMLQYFLEEPSEVPPVGYIRSEEWRKWTTVADETQYLDLPTEHKLRRILLQAIPNVDANNVESTGMHNLMDDIELMLDSGRLRIYKGGIDDLMREAFFAYGREMLTGGSIYHSADKGVRVSLGYVLTGAWGAGSQDGAAAATIATLESGRTSFTQKPETYEADSPIQSLFRGIAYQETVCLPFDLDPNPQTWLDPNMRKTVELNVHTRNASSAASGTNRVILERLVAR
jgi:hypothetical protein